MFCLGKIRHQAVAYVHCIYLIDHEDHDRIVMILDQEKITRIKRLLKARPKGLTISDISHNLKINRNSVAKYLEILLITGQVDMRMYGNAKVYYLSNRVPISSMLKFANELILVLDSDFRVVEANENFFSYFGEKKEDFIGNPIQESTVNRIDGGSLEDIARKAFETGEISEEVSCNKGGVTRYLRIKAVPSVFDDGSRGTTLIFEDITDKKEIEDRLRVSEAKYRAIVEEQTELVDRFDKDMTIIFVNQAICQITGFEKAELIGSNALEFIPEEDQGRVLECIRSLTIDHPVGMVEHRIIGTGARSHWVQWTNRAIFDDKGNIIEYQGVGRDITEKKIAEQQLLIKDLAIASSLNGIGIADLAGKVSYVNRSFLTMFGYDDAAEVLGKPIHLFAHNSPEVMADIDKVLKAFSESGEWSGEVVSHRRDGTEFNALLMATVVRDTAGIPLCLMASFTDITEVKKTREEMQLKDTAIASSINAIAIFDRNYRIMYANDAFLNEFGCDFSEIRGKRPPEIFARFEAAYPAYEEINAALEKEGNWKGEITLSQKGGRRLFFISSFRETIDDSGKLLSVLASFVNITDQKNIETALKSSRQKLSETIEFMPDPTYIIDRNHRVIGWNRALEALSGVRREEVLGKKDFSKAFLFYGGERPVLVDLLDLPPHELARKFPSVRRFGDSIYVEAFIPTMNSGKGAYLWGKATSLIDHEGRVIGAIESIRDISAWKRARESLRKIEASETGKTAMKEEEAKVHELSRMRQELESVLDLMKEAVLLTDQSGTILWANERFVELVDGDRQLVLGANLSLFFPAEERQILTGPETTMRINLIPLTADRIVPVEAKSTGLPQGEERVIILQQL
jgi:PAS domain S-box-containing protein